MYFQFPIGTMQPAHAVEADLKDYQTLLVSAKTPLAFSENRSEDSCFGSLA
jgi:hypothetical protein